MNSDDIMAKTMSCRAMWRIMRVGAGGGGKSR